MKLINSFVVIIDLLKINGVIKSKRQTQALSSSIRLYNR